jgi:hypothetical protein
VTVGDMVGCFICHRDIEYDLTVPIDFGPFVSVRLVCHVCLERGDEGLGRYEPDPEEEEDAA